MYKRTTSRFIFISTEKIVQTNLPRMAQKLWTAPHPLSNEKTPCNYNVHDIYDQEKDEWEVEYILDVRDVVVDKEVNKVETQYLVLWTGYPFDYASWEPQKHLTNCQDKIDECWKIVKEANKRGKKITFYFS